MKLDDESRKRLDLLYPDFKIRILKTYSDMWDHCRVQMRCSASVRSFKEQEQLYNQGRKIGTEIVTWAPPGFSLHHYGVAADSCQKGSNPWGIDWETFGRFGEAHGLCWGGRWNPKKKDSPHLELAYGGLSVQAMVELYNHGGLEAVWAEFDRIRGVPIGQDWYGPQKQIIISDVGSLKGEII